MLAELHSTNSENHRILHEFILQVLSHSSSAQPPRKTPVVKTGVYMFMGLLLICACVL